MGSCGFRVHAGLRGFERIYGGSHGFTRVHKGLHRFAQVRTGSHGLFYGFARVLQVRTGPRGLCGFYTGSFYGFTGLCGLNGLTVHNTPLFSAPTPIHSCRDTPTEVMISVSFIH